MTRGNARELELTGMNDRGYFSRHQSRTLQTLFTRTDKIKAVPGAALRLLDVTVD